MTAQLQRRPPRDRQELDELCQIAFDAMSAGEGIIPACKSATITSGVLYRWMRQRGASTPALADEARVAANKENLEARLVKAHEHMQAGMLIKPACELAGTTSKAMRIWMAERCLFIPGATKVDREKRCANALSSLVAGIDQVKACADAGVSVGCFRRWRAAKGVMPTQAQLAEMRNAR